jgi:hypothetical protein
MRAALFGKPTPWSRDRRKRDNTRAAEFVAIVARVWGRPLRTSLAAALA